MYWLKRLAVLFILLAAMAAVAGYWAYRGYQRYLNTTLAVPAGGITYTVARGANVASIASDLSQRQILQSPHYFRLYARLSDLAAKIKAGEYYISGDTTPRSLLADMVAGRVVEYSLTIVEGWTFRQMLAAVHAHPMLQATLQDLDDADIMARLGFPQQHPEGQFFPDTYRFPAGTSDLDFLRRAHRTMERHLADVWEQRQSKLPLANPYEVLILASIIEKETRLDAERRRVAGVFVRRLRKGMRLQTDPTVIYGMGDDFDGNLRRRDLKGDTPYNTYTREGLPPTPIALPGLASLRAAVDPAAGKSLYFVANGEGGHAFSATLREHNRAVRKYQLRKRQ